MNKSILVIVAILSLSALSGCESEEDRQKAALLRLEQNQQSVPPKQIAPPPYTKPIPHVGDAKMKLPD